jgi:hypothetical protein
MHIIDRIARSCRGLTITCLLLLASQHLAWSQSESALTPALAEARVAALLDGGAAEDSEAVATYNAARELLVGAEKHEQETQQYLDALTNAPRRRAEIQSRIEVLEEEEAAVIPAGLEREALDARLIITRAELNETSGMLEALNRRLAARESSASDIRARLAEIQAQSGVPSSPAVDAAATPSLAEAQAWRDAAAYRALAAERKALSARLDSQAQRYDILALERAEQELQQRVFSDRARALEQALSGQIAEAVDAASAGIDPEDPAFELAMELADGDAQLRSERIDLDRRLADVRREVARVEDLARALEERASTAHRVVQFAGESEALGGVLLAYWGEIDNFTIEDPTRKSFWKNGRSDRQPYRDGGVPAVPDQRHQIRRSTSRGDGHPRRAVKAAQPGGAHRNVARLPRASALYDQGGIRVHRGTGHTG